MLTEELKLSLDLESPLKNGLVTFISFILFGLIPLLPYIIGKKLNYFFFYIFKVQYSKLMETTKIIL